jgi:hypothetical protein
MNTPISIFVSHSSRDKAIARGLSHHLKRLGIRLWIDEAEIRVGDSLIQKISEAVDRVDFLLVLLSQHSVASPWVTKEVNVALTQEICGQRIKVLPCLLTDCTIPPFLQDKKYADLRNPRHYHRAIEEILDAVGFSEPHPARVDQKRLFLWSHIYHGLTNMNEGHDVREIPWFGAADFQLVLDRMRSFSGSIFGIEAMIEDDLVDVEVCELHERSADDPIWYQEAFKSLHERFPSAIFSLSVEIPQGIMDTFEPNKVNGGDA